MGGQGIFVHSLRCESSARRFCSFPKITGFALPIRSHEGRTFNQDAEQGNDLKRLLCLYSLLAPTPILKAESYLEAITFSRASLPEGIHLPADSLPWNAEVGLLRSLRRLVTGGWVSPDWGQLGLKRHRLCCCCCATAACPPPAQQQPLLSPL